MSGPRSRARHYALLALYQWQFGKHTAAEIARNFYDDPAWMDAIARGLADRTEDQALPTGGGFDLQLFDQLFRGVTEQIDELDDSLRPFLDRSLSSVDPVERAILRLAAFELQHSPQLPSPVILDEAIDLAKTFGAEKGHKFVNGVLDKLARHRSNEEERSKQS
ncbi:transcription antitermination factor NusB [Thiorhodovibrio winogradskyi]|uniref:transcription antitermination factor NusB n=1 Tax=Thiorhodovibrio winogradskyi TaxID=77007 RepID=UPI002E2B878C|nr:transcription antitermination factor NusB [Thiorhodovibrio winogradskyi]